MNRDELMELLPDYAFGLLAPEEKQQIDDFVARDADARAELNIYIAATQSIAFTATLQTPPASLADKLQAQLQPSRRTTHQRRYIYYAVGLAAAITVLLLAMFFLTQSDDGADQPTTLADRYEDILDDPNSVRVPFIPDRDGDALEGDLVYLANTNTAILRVSNPPAINEDQVFQIWLVAPEGPNSGGVQSLNADTTYIELPIDRPVEEYIRFGMTIEPAPSSPLINRPSGERIFNIQIQEE